MFKLPDTLNIENVKEVQEELLNYLQEATKDENEDLALDAGELRDIDAAGLQLLISAYRTFAEEGHPIRLINVSEFLEQMLDISGAIGILGKGGAQAN